MVLEIRPQNLPKNADKLLFLVLFFKVIRGQKQPFFFNNLRPHFNNPETFLYVKYDAPEEVGGDRKCFDSPIRK